VPIISSRSELSAENSCFTGTDPCVGGLFYRMPRQFISKANANSCRHTPCLDIQVADPAAGQTYAPSDLFTFPPWAMCSAWCLCPRSSRWS